MDSERIIAYSGVAAAVAAGLSFYSASSQEDATYRSMLYIEQVKAVAEAVSKLVDTSILAEAATKAPSKQTQADILARLDVASRDARNAVGVLSVILPGDASKFTTDIAHSVIDLNQTAQDKYGSIAQPGQSKDEAEKAIAAMAAAVSHDAELLRECAMPDLQRGRPIDMAHLRPCAPSGS